MVDRKKIAGFLNSNFRILGQYHIHDNGEVDTTGDTSFRSLEITRLPVQFGKVDGKFDCSQTSLKTLEGCPRIVNSYFECEFTNITSFQGAPREINGNLYCRNNQFVSLQGMPDKIKGEIWIDYNQKLPLLRLLVSDGGVSFRMDAREQHYALQIEEVLNKFKGQGKRGVLDCSRELINLGKKLKIDLSRNIKW